MPRADDPRLSVSPIDHVGDRTRVDAHLTLGGLMTLVAMVEAVGIESFSDRGIREVLTITGSERLAKLWVADLSEACVALYDAMGRALLDGERIDEIGGLVVDLDQFRAGIEAE